MGEETLAARKRHELGDLLDQLFPELRPCVTGRPATWQRVACRGTRSVVLVGPHEERALSAFGRDRAGVEVEGDQIDVAGLQSTQRGL